MITITHSGGRTLFRLALLAALGYGLFRFAYPPAVAYFDAYMENHPAGETHRPDVFGF